MKKLITLFGVFTALSIVAPATAGLSKNVSESHQDQCSPEAKDALYDSFLQHRKTDQPKAYDEAKKYLACATGEVTEAQQKIIEVQIKMQQEQQIKIEEQMEMQEAQRKTIDQQMKLLQGMKTDIKQLKKRKQN